MTCERLCSGGGERPDFRCRAEPAFHRAVHIPLPLDAGMLAREQQPAMWTGQPGPPGGIECRIKIHVAASCPRIVLPGDVMMPEQFRVPRLQPVEGAHQSLHPFLSNDLLGVLARLAARHERQNAGRAALLLVAIPDGAGGSVAAVCGRTGFALPETPVELQQALGDPAI